MELKIKRKEAIKELKKYEEGLDHEFATPFDMAVLFAIQSLETDETYNLLYEHIPVITLEELKEIREEIRKDHEDFFQNEQFEVAYGLSIAIDAIDKKIAKFKDKN